ncbi:exopolysaccharide production negative regulator [Tasmannia lanceolata]|uniref:exopolysaccharide production negative regulator n=1 Tax=Tasmannia lanceolata TaxID=3420 RepID=UPI004062817D
MDSPEPSNGGKKSLHYILFRCWFTLLLSLIISFFFAFLCGLIAIFIGNSSVPDPASVPAQCKIVSGSVDLRSSRVCELGVFNYKAKNVFYPLERTRFRCRYDYYWASVFKVEYTEDSSGQILHALAEAPKEALPLDCRPSFGVAWLTKDKFKVNETYACSYTPGASKVDIYSDSLFNCQAKDPSLLEMIRRSFVLFTKSKSAFSHAGRVRSMLQGTGAGILTGILSSITVINLVRLLQSLKHKLARQWEASKLHIAPYRAHFRRVCILIAYISAVAWFMLQYGKMLGLSEFFIRSNLGEKPVKG